MSAQPTPLKRPWTRPGVPQTRPNRSFGGLYQTAEHEEQGETLGGVPLHTAEDAVVAAVRLGYRVADEQIERGRRIASRLRGAAAREGSSGLGDAADGLDDLLVKAVQSGLQFIEEAASDPRHPLKRLGSAQLSAIASLLGLRDPVAHASPDEASEGEPPAPAANPSRPSSPAAPHRHVWIRHDPRSDGRAVRVVTCELEGDTPDESPVTFFHLTQTSDPVRATLMRRAPKTVLEVCIRPEHPAGRWRAAVLDGDRLQTGVIEIEL